MPDNYDLGVMQAQLGLGAQGSMNPMGIPTPMPQVRHPSEAARDAVQMTQTAAMQTMQTGAMINGGLGFGLGGFSAQYQANMANIRSQQLGPWQAGMASSMMGMGGYVPGMMPSPVQMTPPYMGIYRPMAPPPMPAIHAVPPTPFIPTPLTPQLPPPMFTTTFERNQQLADIRGHQAAAFAMSAPGVAARAGVGFAGSRIGSGLGALAGAAIGGIPGAAIGGMLGSIGGAIGAEHFLGQGVQNLVDDFVPFSRISRQAAQVRGLTRDFVISGNGLDPTGMGLNRVASNQLARQLHGLAGQTSFQRETGGAFSTQDLMRITSLSGQQGLLDMAQNPDQITNQVKAISKAVKTFMKLAGEPDVAEAIKQIAQMRSMGLSIGESMLAVERAKSYGRMAGTSVSGALQQGLQGAMIFQQQGLSAGLGLQVGMGAMGMARQAIAGGTFNNAQLAMLGGAQGVAQNNVEMAAAMLKQPLLAAAMGGFNSGSGGFQLNSGAVQALAGGRLNIPGMATMGVNNLIRGVQQGGIGALGAFQMDQAELQDQIGRALGPEGIKMMTFQQVLNTQKFLGVRGRGGLYQTAMAMGMPENAAKQLVSEMGSPAFFQNMQQQFAISRQQARAEERERRIATAPTFVDEFVAGSPTARGLERGFSRLNRGFDSAMEGVSALLDEYGANSAAAKTGQAVRRTHRSLLAANPLETRMMANLDYRAVLNDTPTVGRGGRDTAVFRSAGGRAFGSSETLADFRDVFGGNSAADARAYAAAQGGVRGMLGLALANGADIRAELPNIQAGAEGSARGKFATTDEQTEAFKRLSGSIGVRKASALQSRFKKILIENAKARGGSGIGDGQAYTRADYQQMLTAAAAAEGVNVNQVSLADLQTLSVQDAMTQLGAEHHGVFRSIDATGEDLAKAEMDALMADSSGRQDQLFGSAGASISDGVAVGMGLGTAGALLGPVGAGVGMVVGGVAGGLMALMSQNADQESREAGEELLFGKDDDERVGTLAALKAAAQEKGTNSVEELQLKNYMEELQATDPERFASINKKANDIVLESAKDDKTKGILSRAGMSLSKYTINDMTQLMAESKEGYLANKQAMVFNKGLETFADKNVIADAKAAGGTRGDMLKRLLASGKVKGGMMDIASKYQAAVASGDIGAQEAAVQDAYKLSSSGGYSTEQELVGGEISSADRGAQVKSEMAAGVAAEALKEFPDAVKSFKDASEALEKAASNLGNATSLPALVNFNF